MIRYKSFRTIDVDGRNCPRRDIAIDFEAFINEYVECATQNDKL